MNWKKIKLGDLIKVKSGVNLTQENMDLTGPYPVYGGNGITGYHSAYNVDHTTIVIGRVGFYCGSIHITKDKAWVTDNAFVTSFSEEIFYPKFLFYALKKIDLRRYSNSSAQPVISGTGISKVEIPCPPLHIQEQIADTLDKADALRRKDQELLQKYDELAQAIFYDMFGDPVRNDKGWDITHGKDTFIFSSGKFNPTKNLDNSFPYPTYGGNGITGFSKEKLIEYPTIVIGRVGAYCGSVHLTEKESWITDNAIYLKSGFQDFDLTFLLFLFKKLNLNQFADYSGQPKITQKPLEELAYIKPPQILQKKFNQLVQNINSTKNMLTKAYSEDLNENLIYRYFS